MARHVRFPHFIVMPKVPGRGTPAFLIFPPKSHKYFLLSHVFFFGHIEIAHCWGGWLTRTETSLRTPTYREKQFGVPARRDWLYFGRVTRLKGEKRVKGHKKELLHSLSCFGRLLPLVLPFAQSQTSSPDNEILATVRIVAHTALARLHFRRGAAPP